MTPNLFVATQTLFKPKKWFRKDKHERPTRKTEHWESPVPGVYEYIPGRGWYLLATYKNAPSDTTDTDSKEGGPIKSFGEEDLIKMAPPTPVRYSKVLKRYLLSPDYEIRKKHGAIPNERGKMVQAGFFQLDDGVAWVNCWDEKGEFIPGPYKLWCIDAKTKAFRHMKKGDDPEYQRSQANSLANSRQNSFDARDIDRHSQDSRSTEYRSGPGSTRDGPSCPSTRANSIKGLTPSNPASRGPSQANSRRSSPTRGPRSPRLPFDEAKAALSIVAKERAALERSRGTLTESERGRSAAKSPMAVN
ncbi:hypothetical protein K458DRAFT_406490 [Lentithecium fluviatile CBS 122367]|uniref:Uncharacterized protein n=1 Tax=Lentithecium fluviatile CBS 122367 TaxID=1168545 RepID=A0A6G1ITS7_9PLEO|nr:hypothetical protein K458DRAFT_406490 [Lentithecium fluviatile CBS 122367]